MRPLTNRIICGDSTRVLNGLRTSSVDAIITDPPYGIGTRDPKLDEIASYLAGETTLDTKGDIVGHAWSLPPLDVWRSLYRVLKPGGFMAVFGATRTMDLVQLGVLRAGFTFVGVHGWIQLQGAAFGPTLVKPSWEPILVVSKGKARVRELPTALYAPKVRGRHLQHPTIKPVTLMQSLVRGLCPEGGLVLDPYLGSGTTAEAATRESRRCLGIEREPKYVRLAQRRLAASSAWSP